MTGWTIALMFQAMITSTPEMTYAEAYQKSLKTGRPLVILVGADWCNVCTTLKQTTLSQLKREGTMEKVIYLRLDTDKHGAVASKLMRGGKVPQMIIFHKDAAGWHKQHMVGMVTPNALRTAINTAKGAGRMVRHRMLRPPLERMQ